MKRLTTWTAVAAAAGVIAAPAAGQQATRVIGATQPSKGEFDATWLLSVDTYDNDPTGADREVTDVSIRSLLRYGISRDWSATLEVPLVTRETEAPGGDDTITGTGDIRADLRYRFYQHDFGPLNTIRLAVRGGLEAPTETEDIGSHSWDPFVGFSAMYIRGKWGLNGAVDYKLSTSDVNDNAIMGAGEDDLLELGAAAVYRLMPEEWGDRGARRRVRDARVGGAVRDRRRPGTGALPGSALGGHAVGGGAERGRAGVAGEQRPAGA